MIRQLIRLTLVGLLAATFAYARTEAEPLTFGATGDGPRSDEDWAILAQYIADENAANTCAFLIHVGDIWHGTETLPESHYERVANLLKTSAIPWYIVPGDNEWNDLDNPDEGWANWTKYFSKFECNFQGAAEAGRQDGHSENMAWISHGVLMIGINVVGGRIHDEDEWRARHAADLAWVKEHFATDRDEVRAAVVFAQAAPKDKQKDFFDPFVEVVKDFGKPVLYLHGDGHRWLVDEHWRADNLTRVQVDQVSKAPIVHIAVTDDPATPFVFDRHLENTPNE